MHIYIYMLSHAVNDDMLLTYQYRPVYLYYLADLHPSFSAGYLEKQPKETIL